MATQAPIADRHATAPLMLWLGYVAFVIYGSLVPLQYKARPWDEAVAAFQKIPFLNLGIESRADWVSNGVLYVPVGILTVLALRALMPPLMRLLALPIALIFCTALAVGVEFTQLFFPPRTVSQNDLMAEVIGSVLGLILATRFSGWFASVIASLLQDSQRLFRLSLDAYVFAYFAFALFPFDFLLSASEIAVKAQSSSWGWLLAGSGHRVSIVVLRLTAEIILTLPLGWWLARWIQARKSRRRERHQPSKNYGLAIAFGLALGLLLETAQFFIASGVSQGLSVLTRLVGMAAGVSLSRHASGLTLNDAMRWIRRFGGVLLLLYVPALLEVNGWLSKEWMGFAHAQVQWGRLNFMPFYYHYFTTEAIALFSLSAVFLSYLPMGLLCWAFKINITVATVMAMGVAILIEAGKLFLKGIHPDPTNALIAGAAVWVTLAALRLAANPRVSPQGIAPTVAVGSTMAAHPVVAENNASSLAKGLVLAAAGCAALVWGVTLPGAPVLATGVLLAACVAVWLKPHWAFGIIAAALPVFDLAPLTGRFFLDEFDILVGATLCIAFARAPRVPSPHAGRARRRVATSDASPAAAAILFGVMFAISTAIGLSPWQWPDLNAFNSYFSPYNALRIAKGAAWAGLFWWVSQRFSKDVQSPRSAFSVGLVAGLAMTVAVVIWERITFVGLLDFTTDYRITGPMSGMHIGGAYIECLLAVAAPLLVYFMIRDKRWWMLAAGMGLLLATTYALMVTFSRNGYFAFAVGICIIFVAGVTMKGQAATASLTGRLARNGLLAGGALAAVLAIAVPIFKGEFSQARMATVSADLQVRQAHWQDALNLRDGGWLTALFGMGVGRYPATNLWAGTKLPTSATYQLASESGNTFLRLSAGSPIYVEQVLPIEPLRKYVLKFSVRPRHAGRLSALLDAAAAPDLASVRPQTGRGEKTAHLAAQFG